MPDTLDYILAAPAGLFVSGLINSVNTNGAISSIGKFEISCIAGAYVWRGTANYIYNIRKGITIAVDKAKAQEGWNGGSET